MKSRAASSLGVVVLFVAAASCSSGDRPASGPGTSEKVADRSPLTGLGMPGGRPDNPVFIVKIENTAKGEPQYGLDEADLVVEELIEGGRTRLAALYYSALPTKVGHVRSMRATDIGIAAPVAGQIVASGGANRPYKRAKRSGVPVFIEDRGAPGFRRSAKKVRPYNLLANLRDIAAKAKPQPIPGPYLDWTRSAGDAPTPEPAPRKATEASVRFSSRAKTSWRFADGHWTRTNGHAAAGHDFAPNTLIVMFCRVSNAGYVDAAGSAVPETIIKGSGRAVVLQRGTAAEATWKKRTREDPISFASEYGQPITIEPGHVWVELVPVGAGGVEY